MNYNQLKFVVIHCIVVRLSFGFQNEDIRKAYLIEANADLVTRAMAAINTAVANQMSWPEIEEIVDDAKQSGDPTAKIIQGIKFDINHLTLLLK